MSDGKTTARITLDVAGPSREAIVLAIRQCLKIMLRTYGIRCLSIAMTEPRAMRATDERRERKIEDDTST